MKRIILPGLLLLAAFGNAQEAIRYNPGFFQTPLTRGDDATSEPAPLGFNINFFGRLHSQVYVNTNGNITLSRPLEAYRPLPLRDLRSDIIAPFWADVDTRGPGSRVVTFGYDFVDGHFAFAANWVDVGYFSQKQDKKNAFQVVIIDRTETGAGNFDIELNYGYIHWEAGDLSGGVNGIGGVAARAGYSAGPNNTFELPGSGLAGSFLDSSTTALVRRMVNSAVPGRAYFQSRAGAILQSLILNPDTMSFSLAPRITAFRNLSFSSTGNVIRGAVTSNAPWLQFDQTSIVTPSSAQVVVKTDGLSPGLYTGRITVTPDNPMIAPVSLPVALSVGQPSPNCTYTLNSGSLTVSAVEGAYSVDVKAPAGCVWRASSNNDWIRIRTGAEGSGDGPVTFAISPNVGKARAGSMVIEGRTFTVLQDSAAVLSAADSRVCRIETLAGNGEAAYYGDEVITSWSVAFRNPQGVAATPSNAILVADTGNRRVRRFTTGFVRPVETLRVQPSAIAYDSQGNIFVTDTEHHQVYRISYDGRFELFAGRGDAGYGERGYSGDQGLALQAQLNGPTGVAVANDGVVYIADTGNHVIRAVDRTGVIRTFAGRGIAGFGGDGDYALNGMFRSPTGLAFDVSKSNLYVADTGNNRIRKITPDSLLSTVAGNGDAGFSADGQQALRTRLNGPTGVAADSLGNVFIADRLNHRIRMVRADGTISTIAGNGTAGFNGDGVGTLMQMSSPFSVSVDADDRIAVADTGNQRLRRIACSPGLLTPEGTPRITDLISSASKTSRTVAPLSFLTLRGANLSLGEASFDGGEPGGLLPTELGGVRVLVNGKLAFPYRVSPAEVTVLLPEETATGVLPVEVQNENGSAFGTVAVEPYAPAIYVDGLKPLRTGQTAVIPVTGVGPLFPAPPDNRQLAVPSQVPETNGLKLFLDGVVVRIESAVMTQLGTVDLTFTVPAALNGDAAVEVRAGGKASQNGVRVPIEIP